MKTTNKDEKLTPSLILKMFAETDKKIEEIKQQLKEIDKIVKELAEDRKRTDRMTKELFEDIGEISNGEMVEKAIFNALGQNMMFAGIDFEYILSQKKRNTSLNLEIEIDALLVNSTMLALIETSYRVDKKDVLKLATDKLVDFKKLFPEFNNHKIMLGIGGMSFENDAIIAAKEKGIGIIKIVGDKVEYQTENVKIY